MAKAKVIGLDKVVKNLKQLPENIINDVDKALARGANDIVNLARQLTPVDEGKLRNATTSARLDRAAYEITNNVFYAPYQEFGTGPKYKPQAGFEDVAAAAKNLPNRGNFRQMVAELTQWVKRKGISGTYSVKTRKRTGRKKDNEKQDRQIAYLIARKILREGLEPKPFFIPAVKAYQEKILEDVKKAVTKKR